MSVISYHNPNEDFNQKRTKTNNCRFPVKAAILFSALAITAACAGLIIPKIIGKEDNTDSINSETALIISDTVIEDSSADNSVNDSISNAVTSKDTVFENTKSFDESETTADDSTQRIKIETLEKASAKAEAGEYKEAILIIKAAQSGAEDDIEYINAIEAYKEKYRSSVLSKADKLSKKGEYVKAINKARETAEVLGSDTEVDNKVKEYEALYVTSVVTKAEELIAAKDYDGADSAVSEGLQNVPGNTELSSEAEKIAASRPISNDMIMTKLNENRISDSGGYCVYLGNDSINVFAEDVTNAFSQRCLASYNLWTSGIQTVDFRVDQLNINTLCFTICGETGTSGAMTVEIYIDRPIDDSTPDYKYELQDAPYPVEAEVNISGAKTMAVRVRNHDDPNTIVFYNFRGQ